MKKKRKYFLLTSLMLIMSLLISCSEKETELANKDVSEKTTVKTQEKFMLNNDKDNDENNEAYPINISKSFSYEDFQEYAKNAGVPINMCEYFSTYYYGTDKSSFESFKGISGNWEYTVFENKKAFLTNYNGKETSITVPNVIDGYDVIGLVCRFQKGDFIPNNTIIKINIKNGIQYIGDDVFENCFSLKEITLPTSLLCIDNGSFLGCKSLKKISLPSNLICIDDSSFFECESLEEIVIPNSVIYLGCYAFFGCYKLSRVQLSDSITQLNGDTFRRCKNLSYINIPKNLSSIYEADFQGTNINIDMFLNEGVKVY